MRHWLLTNTTYGTWLPGSPRGSVTSVRDRRPTDPPFCEPGASHSEPGASATGAEPRSRPPRIVHNRFGDPWEPSLPGLYRAARNQMKGPPVYLNHQQAEVLLGQFLETAQIRQWTILAVSIMPNHFHLVVQVQDDPPARKILADFKAYASRKLNQHFGPTGSNTWWTTGGSKRKLQHAHQVRNAVAYVLYRQPRPLVVYSGMAGRIV